jgi:hypothetical protein
MNVSISDILLREEVKRGGGKHSVLIKSGGSVQARLLDWTWEKLGDWAGTGECASCSSGGQPQFIELDDDNADRGCESMIFRCVTL